MKRTYLVLLGAILMAWLFQCAKKPTDVSSGGSDHGNAIVTGHLFNADRTPAANATVQLVRVDHNPQAGTAVAASVTTDQNGEYGFDSLPQLTYNLFGQGNSGVCYKDSIGITKDTLLSPDTLRAPGSLSGVVRLVPKNDSGQVFIILLGTNYYTMPSDTNGNFSIANMAGGKYRTIILTTLKGYVSVDTEFSIASGQNMMIRDTIELRSNTIPAPTGFGISYDTLKQIVTLSWNRMNPAKAKGFNVYRQHVDSSEVKVNAQPLIDTFYVDSTGIKGRTYIYSVASVDLGNKEGFRTVEDTVKITSAFYISDTLFTAGGWINAIDLDKSGNFIVVRFVTPNSAPAKVERYDGAGHLLNSWDIPNGIEFSNSFNNVATDDSNFIYVINSSNQIIKFNDTGAVLNQTQFPGTARGFSIFKDTLYIGDQTTFKIFAYSTKGDSLFSWGSEGLQDGQFKHIISICNDAQGNVYIEDALDYGRVQVFSGTGSFLRSFSFQQFAIENGATDLVGAQLDIKDSLILVTGSNVYGFSLEGTHLFSSFDLLSPRRAFFDNAGNIKVALWTGQVVSLNRK